MSAIVCFCWKRSLRPIRALVQVRNDIELTDTSAPLEAWELFDATSQHGRRCPHFSVEMETGTGKTYVYLRTIFELSRRYGFQKFIIVVPSVAIREGVLKNIDITAEHFRALFNNLPFEHFVYDARRINRCANSPSATRSRFSSSTLTPFVRTSPGPRKSRRATSFTRKATSFPVASPSSSCRRRGRLSSSTSRRAWIIPTKRRKRSRL